MDLSRAAVVVIDMQNDFVHPEGVCAKGSSRSGPLYNGISLFDNLPTLIEAARSVDAVIVFVRMINDPTYLTPPVADRLEKVGLLGVGLQSETWGADYHDQFQLDSSREREFEVIKHRYSAFHGTNLAQLLRENKVETILYTGVGTSGCVESTAREGLFHDFYGVMVSDCVADGNRDNHHSTLRKYEQSFGDVLSSDTIIRTWAASRVTADVVVHV